MMIMSYTFVQAIPPTDLTETFRVMFSPDGRFKFRNSPIRLS